MARLSNFTSLSIALGMLCVPISSWSQTPFASADKNLTFIVPEGWKAEETGGKLALIGANGARYSILRDALPPAPAGEAANNSGLREAAQKLAQPLVAGLRYAGVRPVVVDAGSGAIYRFRGKGSKSDDDLAEVWVATVGNHTIAILPEAVPQPDHLYELTTLLKTIAFADSPKVAARGGPNARAKPPVKPNTPEIKKPDDSKKTSQDFLIPPKSNPSRLPATTGKSGEGYTGHLLPNDVSFSLKLYDDKTAAADWTTSPEKSSHFAGSYTGTDGSFVVKLTKSTGENSLNAGGLTLVMRGMGGVETGTFSTDTSTAKRAISELTLTSVEGGSAGKKGVGKGRSQRRNQQMRRGNQQMRRRGAGMGGINGYAAMAGMGRKMTGKRRMARLPRIKR